MQILHAKGCRPSARRLRQELRRRGVNPKGITLNWGRSDAPDIETINPGWAIRPILNKLDFLIKADMNGNRDCCIPWTVQPELARNWWRQVFCRTTLTGKGGAGILVWRGEGPLPDAKLYTKGVKKDGEFRIHLGRKNGVLSPFDAQAKLFKKTDEMPAPLSWAVRSYDNGFRFTRNIPDHLMHGLEKAEDVAKKVAGNFSRDLHFVAMDVIWNKETDRAYVLEGNTAPGLEGLTVVKYANMIEEIIKNGEI